MKKITCNTEQVRQSFASGARLSLAAKQQIQICSPSTQAIPASLFLSLFCSPSSPGGKINTHTNTVYESTKPHQAPSRRGLGIRLSIPSNWPHMHSGRHGRYWEVKGTFTMSCYYCSNLIKGWQSIGFLVKRKLQHAAKHQAARS